LKLKLNKGENMRVESFGQGVVFWQDKSRLTVMLLVPFYSFWPRYETRRAGCPIGLELIASELVAKGFNVVFIDACMSAYSQFTQQEDGTTRYGLTDGQLERVLINFNPAVVGITSLFSNQCGNVETVARIVRHVYPEAIIVEGGSHATGDVDEVLKSSNVDMVVREEGLQTFPALCLSIEQRKSRRNFTEELGISFKNEVGWTIENDKRPFLPNFDGLAERQLAIPLHRMYDTPEHTGGSRFHKNGRFAYIVSTVGCGLTCKFCHIWKMLGKVRGYSLARFRHEVARLKAAGVTELIIEDDMFFDDIPRALAVAEVLKENGMVWFEEGGLSMFRFMNPLVPGLTYKEILDKLAETGCYRFYLAIESANKESLKRSKKPPTNANADLAEEIVRYTAQKGIQAVGGFMIGFKGNDGGFEESLEDMERTIAFAKRLKLAGLDYVMLFIVTAIVGTELYEYISSVFPNLNLRTSHERSAFPVGGLTPYELTEKRLEWMAYVNGESCMNIATRTKNWGL
jgi:anaerobic magnesium-protoporphyrin IX monomethyl ester cyclase